MMRIRPLLLAGVLGGWFATVQAQPAANDAAGPSPYTASGGIDMGVQPMAYPIAYLSAVIQHDRILKKQFAATNTPFVLHPSRKGPDLVGGMVSGQLEAAIAGDMPTLEIMMRSPTVVVGLAKKNFSSVVARDYTRIDQLRGKRVAFAMGTNSHNTLLRGLAAANMSEKDIILVPMETSAMPAALLSQQIDAFAAWEPTPTIALSQDKRNRAIYKNMSTAWLLFSARFAEQQPKQALQLVAAYVRAINWLRANAKNIEQATTWVLAESERFSGMPPAVTREQAIALLHNDLLSVPGAPVVLDRNDAVPPLFSDLAFLQAQGKMPGNIEADMLRKAFAYNGLSEVMKAPKQHRIYEFDYAE